ncbi:hypothetical protein [Marinoscillum furvescens]|uniref:hypothetical protein n=1 Tax=Marinoscillum furvescens TaxID=1026 RepID=UPI0011C04CF8|nr:hypothetical protein [Marinoscillum furvescens]
MFRLGQGYRSVVSVLALVLLPKCSLCVFAIGSAISVCGLDRATTPTWEYALILALCLLPLWQLRRDCAGKIHLMAIALCVLGTGVILLSFSGNTFSATGYYVGISLLSGGQLVAGSMWRIPRKAQPHCKSLFRN